MFLPFDSIWRKIHSMGLANLHETNDDFRLFRCQIDGLAFLPTDEVSEGMTYLRKSALDEATQLLNYLYYLCDKSQIPTTRSSNEVLTQEVSSCSVEYAGCNTC